MAFLERNANRGSVSTGFNIDNSLKLERANSEKLSRTPSSASNLRTWTYSFWLKRTQLGINSYHLEAKGSGDRFFILGFNENDQILFYDIFSDDYGKAFTRRFRDTTAWYHIVLRADTGNGTAGNRMRLYVNGVQETVVTSDYGDFPQNHDTQINKAVVHNIGYRTDINQYASGYQAETCLIDGASLAPTSFGEFDEDSGIWKPIDVTELTFGTNGFYQEYKSGSALGADTVPGGNSNDYAASNIAAADQATDTPTNNFTTWNTLRRVLDDEISFKEGATVVVTASGNGWRNVHNTIAVNKGKWYFEGELYSNEITQMFGNQPTVFSQINVNQNWYLGSRADGQAGAAYYGSGDDVYYEGGYANSSASTEGDIISVALDCDNNKIHFAVNGTYTNSSNPVNNTNGFPMTDEYQYFATAIYPGSASWKYNFGGYTTISISSAASDAKGYGTFEYAPPSGYYSLCSKNLAEYG